MYYIEENQTFFLILKNPRIEIKQTESYIKDELVYAELLYTSSGNPPYGKDNFPFYANRIRLLKDWEVVKYKLLGYI